MLTLSRKQRLRALENEIRSGMEEFYYTGMKLKEIRDDELYKEDGFSTWEAYVKERWEWSRSHAHKLITASEYRDKLLTLPNGQHEWSERSVRELTRLEDKRDAVKVAARVVKLVEQSEKEAAKDPEVKPIKLTAATVRKAVDEELGIDRTAKAKEAKRQRQKDEAEAERRQGEGADIESRFTELVWHLKQHTDGLKQLISELGDEEWMRWKDSKRALVKRLTAACDAFTDLLRSDEE